MGQLPAIEDVIETAFIGAILAVTAVAVGFEDLLSFLGQVLLFRLTGRQSANCHAGQHQNSHCGAHAPHGFS